MPMSNWEVAGAKAHFGSVSLVGGKILLLDIVKDVTREVCVDEVFSISNAQITVRSKVGYEKAA